MTISPSKKITASELYNYKQCELRPFLDLNESDKLKSEVDPLLELLWARGAQFEEKVISEFKRRTAGRSFLEVSFQGVQVEEAFEQTRKAMAEGYDYIYQGTLMMQDMLGRPDLLIKKKGRSDLGQYFYAPLDIKSSFKDEEWDDGEEKLNIAHLWQLHFYADLLEETQGFRPEKGYILKGIRRSIPAFLSHYPKGYLEAMSRLRNYRAGNQNDATYAIGSQCGNCHWQARCREEATRTRDVSLLYRVGPSFKKGLNLLGYQNIDQILEVSAEEFSKKVARAKDDGEFWPTMPHELAKQVHRRARLYNRNERRMYAKPEFAEANVEFHYDIEDDPTQGLIYLHGVFMKRKGEEGDYTSFFCDDENGEKKVFLQFLDFLHENDSSDSVLYHYAPHEKGRVLELAKKYEVSHSMIDKFFVNDSARIDLWLWIDRYTDWPLTSYSLKAICKSLGYQWQTQDADGGKSVVWFNRYQSGEKKLRKTIIEYNRDDCIATFFLKNKLIELYNNAKKA